MEHMKKFKVYMLLVIIREYNELKLQDNVFLFLGNDVQSL